MRNFFNIFLTLLVLISGLTIDVNAAGKKGKQTIKVVWDQPEKIVRGGYPRVHRLNDGRLMLCYSSSANTYVRFSDDDGYTWTEDAQVVMKHFSVDNELGKAKVHAANPEFAQLSEDNPHKPGRIIFACNYRPMNPDPKAEGDDRFRSSVFPYTIAIKTSDDDGKTWYAMKHVYKSEVWDHNALSGCWEPFVLELPDGTVQIYFADETPYYSLGSDWHNISVIESKDGGDTWEKVRVVSQNGACRDGMPVVAMHDDMLYLAIESTDYKGERLHPIVISNPIKNNWKTTVGNGSTCRFEPFQTSLKSEVVYSGSPYIITTDNYIVYSYQIADWWTPPAGLTASQQLAQAKENNDANHATMEVQVCPLKEVSGGYFRQKMRAPSRPFPYNKKTGKESAIWNSLCDLGNDEILAVSQYKSAVYTVKGKIVGGR